MRDPDCEVNFYSLPHFIYASTAIAGHQKLPVCWAHSGWGVAIFNHAEAVYWVDINHALLFI